MTKKNTLSRKQRNQISAWLKNGQMQAAFNKLGEILSHNTANTEAWLLRGQICRETGNLDEAVRSYNTIIQHQNAGNYSALENLAQCFLQLKQYDKAILCYRQLLQHHPNDAVAHSNLGALYLQKNDITQAIKLFERAITIKPNYFDAIRNLCICYSQEGPASYTKIIAILEPLIAEVDRPTWVISMLSQIYMATGRFLDVIHVTKLALNNNPQDNALLTNIANAYYSLEDFGNAAKYCETLIGIDPDNTSALLNLSLALQKKGEFNTSLEYIKKAIDKDPGNPLFQCHYANILYSLGEHEPSSRILHDILRKEPNNAFALTTLFSVLQNQKDTDAINKLLATYANMADSHIPVKLIPQLLNISISTDHQSRFQQLSQDALNNQLLDNDVRMRLNFYLAKLFDKEKKYDTAFDYLHKANSLKALNNSIYELSLKEFDRLLKINASDIASIPSSENKTDTPVFILGMPRSGTSLVEQIISSHALASGAGELTTLTNLLATYCLQDKEKGTFPECMFSLAPSDVNVMASSYMNILDNHREHESIIRITDKMPANFRLIILITKLFPNAHIIHCTRNPLDTCLSIYFQDFTETHHYAYDLAKLGEYYAYYEKLVDHQKSLISATILEIQYEELVSDIESYSRKIISFCGLEWDENCLNFHESKRFVRTASQQQVNKPVYTSSIARWKHYQKHLQPLSSSLESTRKKLVQKIE